MSEPPHGPAAPRSGRLLASVLSVLVILGAAAGAVVAHSTGDDRSAIAAPQKSGVPSPAVDGNGTRTSEVAPSTSSTPYSPPAPPTPTHRPLDPQAVNRTFEVYMDALLDNNMSSLRSATCPRLRHTLKGFALHGKYLRRWKGLPYQIYSALDYVRLSAEVYFASPDSGTAVYDWYVERTPVGDYYVCGFLS